MSQEPFTFVDLFAGIGGFHAALSGMGGRCVYAVEKDERAAAVYERNWRLDPRGDITVDTSDERVVVPPHDVLAAGFPCQPFSKSGAQRGMEETRGTLYWNILRVVQEHHPSVVLLENVRNLAGPRHLHEWQVIVQTLRDEGYRVSETPAIFSPHLLPRERGGRPQVRERVFITATHDPDGAPSNLDVDPVVDNVPVPGWDPDRWDLRRGVPLEPDRRARGRALSDDEVRWIDAWDEFVSLMWAEREGNRLPGHPLWADDWVLLRDLDVPDGTPAWKADLLHKNAVFYTAHRPTIDRWASRWDVYGDRFPPSRRKLEWQAQDTARLWDCVLHLRPSGIRAKRPTYLPALVAMTQTSILGSRRRRLSPREAARLQGLPDWFDFGDQPDSATYRQLGNGVSVGAVWHVLKQHAERDAVVLRRSHPRLLRAITDAPLDPDDLLAHRG